MFKSYSQPVIDYNVLNTSTDEPNLVELSRLITSCNEEFEDLGGKKIDKESREQREFYKKSSVALRHHIDNL